MPASPSRWPALAALVPFVPVVALWWVVAAWGRSRGPSSRARPRSSQRFVTLTYKGILPAYLEDSVGGSPSAPRSAWPSASRSGSSSGLSNTAYGLLWPLLLFFQAIGDIAWLPILLIWFGFGLATMTFVIVYTVLFPVVFNTVLGVRSVPIATCPRGAEPRRLALARFLREVIVPGALPNIVTGLRNGLGYGWRALIAAEIIVGTSGIGFMMFDARRAGSATEIVLGMIVLGLLWYVVDAWILAPIERATGQRWGLVGRT